MPPHQYLLPTHHLPLSPSPPCPLPAPSHPHHLRVLSCPSVFQLSPAGTLTNQPGQEPKTKAVTENPKRRVSENEFISPHDVDSGSQEKVCQSPFGSESRFSAIWTGPPGLRGCSSNYSNPDAQTTSVHLLINMPPKVLCVCVKFKGGHLEKSPHIF